MITDRPLKSTRFPRRFWRNRPCLPRSRSVSDFNLWLCRPMIGRPRLPLSIKASTASCNIRRSFRRMICGAESFFRCLSLLLRFITRRYRSFRSLVAYRPPSSCTIGCNSGGNTGRTVITIHSGRLPLVMNASITLKRLIALVRFWPDDSRIRAVSSSLISCRFVASSSFLTASAPMPA